ncbi:MAG TPA: hypothetical protein PKZ04_17680 [Reyranella sp.]|jgi:hypothetical protein|nr:hypothetical protein [Reyranella sp.]
MLTRVMASVQADLRLEALLGTGSMVTGEFDEESDLDLVLLVRPDAFAGTMADRRTFAGGLGGLLACFSGEHVGEPRLLICLYGPPLLHVDFKFVSTDDLSGFVERPLLLWAREPETMQCRLDALQIKPARRDGQWFEDRAWVWMHYSATKIRRGEYFEALAALDFFREAVLGPMLRRHAGERPRGLRRIETSPGAAERLLSTVSTCDSASLVAAWHASIALYLDLRAADPPPYPTAHMPAALRDFLDGTA